MGATRPTLPGNPLSAHGGLPKARCFPLPVGCTGRCLLVVFFTHFLGQSAFPRDRLSPTCEEGFCHVNWLLILRISARGLELVHDQQHADLWRIDSTSAASACVARPLANKKERRWAKSRAKQRGDAGPRASSRLQLALGHIARVLIWQSW